MMIHVKCIILIIKLNFETMMLRSSLRNCSNVHILVKRTMAVAQVAAPPAAVNNGKEIVSKNCSPFTDNISEINNTQIDSAKCIDVIMPMHNLIEYSNNYSKVTESLWQYYRDEPALTDDGTISNFHAAHNSSSYKFKQKITDVTDDYGRRDVEITGPSKYLSKFFFFI